MQSPLRHYFGIGCATLLWCAIFNGICSPGVEAKFLKVQKLRPSVFTDWKTCAACCVTYGVNNGCCGCSVETSATCAAAASVCGHLGWKYFVQGEYHVTINKSDGGNPAGKIEGQAQDGGGFRAEVELGPDGQVKKANIGFTPEGNGPQQQQMRQRIVDERKGLGQLKDK
ncbi:unnamed protein product [Amoebophrya sp. A120]|nr:unnamed protein product [Amoebophrya sp. A120]|eukprot:GSA120T00006479001.1